MVASVVIFVLFTVNCALANAASYNLVENFVNFLDKYDNDYYSNEYMDEYIDDYLDLMNEDELEYLDNILNMKYYDEMIWNGESPSPPDKYPFMVWFMKNISEPFPIPWGKQACSGTLINSTPVIILTAAHCFTNHWKWRETEKRWYFEYKHDGNLKQYKADLWAVVGASHVNPEKVDVPQTGEIQIGGTAITGASALRIVRSNIKYYKNKPPVQVGGNTPMPDDIALVIMKDISIPTPSLPQLPLNKFEGWDKEKKAAKKSLGLGFGRIGKGEEGRGKGLKEMKTWVISPNECVDALKQRWIQYMIKTKKHMTKMFKYDKKWVSVDGIENGPGYLCVTDHKKGATMCHGDSGGALLQKHADGYYVIVGVGASGHNFSETDPESCNGGSINFWTNVKHYLPWIQEEIKEAKK